MLQLTRTMQTMTYVEFDGELLPLLAKGRRRVRRYESLGDGRDKLVALALHRVRGQYDACAWRAQVGPRHHLR